MHPQTTKVQAEYDALKDHIETYIQQSAAPVPEAKKAKGHTRTPSRHIAQITQAAQRALRRNVPGLAASSASSRAAKARSLLAAADGQGKQGWDDLRPYTVKASWREAGVERGQEGVDALREAEEEVVSTLERRWTSGWAPPLLASLVVLMLLPRR